MDLSTTHGPDTPGRAASTANSVPARTLRELRLDGLPDPDTGAQQLRNIPVSKTSLRLFGATGDAKTVVGDFDPVDGSDLRAWSRWCDDASERSRRDRVYVDTGRTWRAFPFRRLVSGPVTPFEIPAKRFTLTHGLHVGLNQLDTLPEARTADRYLITADRGRSTRQSAGPRAGAGDDPVEAAAVHRFLTRREAHQALWDAVDHAANYLIPVEALPVLEDHERLPDELRADIRLPYPTVNVWFAEPLDVDLARLDVTCVEIRGDLRIARSETELFDPSSWVMFLASTALADRVQVDGIQLRAAADGTLDDACIWFLHLDYEDRYYAAAVPARRSASSVRAFVDLVAAVAAWAHWTGADDPTGGLDADELRRELHTGKLRRAVRNRTLNPAVRVLDLRTSSRRPAPAGADGPVSGRGMSAHLRRGHWRRVRCGPRTGWRYEYRWILPAVVGGHAAVDPNRVYRLVVPTAAGNSDDLDERTDPTP